MGRSLSFLKEVLPMVSNFSTIVSFMCLLVSTLLPIPFFCSSQQPKSWSILSFVLQSLFVPVGAMTVECFRIGNGKIMGQFSLLLKEVLPMLLHGLQKTADIATIVSFTCFVLTQFLSFPFFPDWLHNLYSIPCVQFLSLRIPSWPYEPLYVIIQLRLFGGLIRWRGWRISSNDQYGAYVTVFEGGGIYDIGCFNYHFFYLFIVT